MKIVLLIGLSAAGLFAETIPVGAKVAALPEEAKVLMDRKVPVTIVSAEEADFAFDTTYIWRDGKPYYNVRSNGTCYGSFCNGTVSVEEKRNRGERRFTWCGVYDLRTGYQVWSSSEALFPVSPKSVNACVDLLKQAIGKPIEYCGANAAAVAYEKRAGEMVHATPEEKQTLWVPKCYPIPREGWVRDILNARPAPPPTPAEIADRGLQVEQAKVREEMHELRRSRDLGKPYDAERLRELERQFLELWERRSVVH